MKRKKLPYRLNLKYKAFAIQNKNKSSFKQFQNKTHNKKTMNNYKCLICKITQCFFSSN